MTDNNPLLAALANGELHKLLLGYAPYFFDGRSENEEPQNVNLVFDLLMLPYWESGQHPEFPAIFKNGLLTMLEHNIDMTEAIYIAADWLWYYHYCLQQKRQRPDGQYARLFEIDLGDVGVQLKRLMQRHRQDLMHDLRWAGAAWNSDSGMWQPLLRSAINVRDKLHGPDFVPSE